MTTRPAHYLLTCPHTRRVLCDKHNRPREFREEADAQTAAKVSHPRLWADFWDVVPVYA